MNSNLVKSTQLFKEQGPVLQLASLTAIPQLFDIKDKLTKDINERNNLAKKLKKKTFSLRPWSANRKNNKKAIKSSPLFDVGFYLFTYPEVIEAEIDPYEHFLEYGGAKGYNPHPLFLSRWYVEQNPDVAKSGVNPLIHYLYYGGFEGRDPHPLFDSSYYLKLYPDVDQEKINPLLHYVLHGASEGRRPHPLFDSAGYLALFPEISGVGITPIEHYCYYGKMTNFRPHQLFDPDFYFSHYPEVLNDGVNPLVHYLVNGSKERWRDPCALFSTESYFHDHPELIDSGINPLVHCVNNYDPADFIYNILSGDDVLLSDNLGKSQVRLPVLQDRLLFFEHEQKIATAKSDIKILAFYFPQFHPFVENDTFWGTGFTEWTNCTKTQPLFDGHLQPRLPGELGFYDTRIKDVLKRQIELAKTHGIHGICFHHYWFMGRRVMRVPYDMMLANPDLDIPFCLHWANEPWTVRWDGFGNKGVLLEQNHTPDDDIAFIKDIEPALRDRRYIKVDGKPLLIIYRPSLFPDIRATIKRWNDYCESSGIGKLYLAVMQTCFEGDMDPTKYGFDAAIEYPPHNMGLQNINSKIDFFDKSFSGNVLSYPELVEKNRMRPKPNYTLFRGLLPGWDCTPRRKNPDLIINQSPWKYQEWLESHIDYTKKYLSPSEQFIFVNAWNEWAEGAYLDPDRHFGYAYLNATARALNFRSQKTRIAVVLHIYFTELLDEFIGYFRNIPFDFDLYVSTSAERKCEVEEKLFHFVGDRNVHVLVFPNKGRDMGPFVVGYKDIFPKYDLVCFLHSKKSSYGTGLENWRPYLLNNLLGSSDSIQKIVEYFSEDPELGMICPDIFPPVASMAEWGSNHHHVKRLADKMGIEIDFSQPPVFPTGSMFWFRPEALKPMFNLGIGYKDFEDKSESKNDGTLAHAFERLFFNVVELSGYNWRKVLFTPEEPDKGDVFTPPIKLDIQNLLTSAPPRLAVILHLYYEDLSEEIASYLHNIPLPFDLYISTKDGAAENRIKEIFGSCPNVAKIEIRSPGNRGRDILPFNLIYKDIYPEKYDLICKIHSKKSLFNEGHSTWRGYLFDNLLGSTQIVKTILYYFMTDASLGMLYPRTYIGVKDYNNQDPWRDNWDNCEKLAKRLEIHISRGMSLDFPSGSMFWFRPTALNPLYELNLTADDFEKEKGQLDATVAHAIERMFGQITQKAGFTIRKVYFREEVS